MIEIKNVSFVYAASEKKALDNVSLTVNEGDFIGITGEGGAGKTTLAHALSGAVPHYFSGDFYGAVTVDGADTVETSPEALARLVGSVFQDVDSQLVMTNVYDEMLFGLENFGTEHSLIEERVDEALELVGIRELKKRDIASLSGGQRQKVAVASIIALKPKYLVLDEPTGELDPKSSRRIFSLLRELNESYGVTVIVIEQKIMLLSEFVKRLAVMSDGAILIEGTAQQVLQNDELLRKAGINVPRIVTLSGELKKRGLYSGDAPVSIESAAAMVEEARRR